MLLLTVVVAGLVIGFLILKGKADSAGEAAAPGKGKSKRRPEAFKPCPVFTSSELALYHRLSEALPDHIILSQVSYLAFVRPKVSEISLLNSIGSRRIDFIVLDRHGEFVTGIELDGSAHDNDKAAADDMFKTQLMQYSGLKLIRWRAEKLPKGPEIVAQVLGEKPAVRGGVS